MIIKIMTEMFRDELEKLVKIVPKKPVKPILSGMLFSIDGEHITMQATDMENSMRTVVDAVQHEGDGKFVVGGRMLYSIVKSTNDNYMTLNHHENRLTITAGHSQANLPVMSAEDFPELNFTGEEPVEYTVDLAALKQGLDNVIEYASPEEATRNLHGVKFEFNEASVVLVAADSFRLAVNEILQENEVEREFLINLKGVKQLRGLLDRLPPQEYTNEEGERRLRLQVDKGKLLLLTHRLKYAIRLTEAGFPNWQEVIPDSFKTTVEVDAKALRQELEIPALIASDNGDTVVLDVKDGVMHISARQPDRGDAKAEVEVKQDGNDIKIAFDPQFLLTALKNIDGVAELNFVDEDSALQINEKDKGRYLQIVMPVKMRS